MADRTTPTSNHDTLFLQGAQLALTWPDGRQERIALANERLQAGRTETGNQIAAPSSFSSISRQHFAIEPSEKGYTLIDLGSTNGTLVNGEPIDTPTLLQDGDLIEIGSAESGQLLQITFQAGVASLLSGIEAALETETGQVQGFLKNPPANQPYLEIRWPDGQHDYFPLLKANILLGRDPLADLRIPDALRFVSKQHARIEQHAGKYYISDLGSTNGTRVNNQKLAANTEYLLPDQATIRIGDESFGISVGLTLHHPQARQVSPQGYAPALEEPTLVSSYREMLIGRDQDCDLVLSSPDVSRQHARITILDEAYEIEDLGSTNGTLVNEVRITRQLLHEGDLIQIGTHLLLFQDGELRRYDSQGMRVDVQQLSKSIKVRGGKLEILKDINLTILPREFIAIVGGSGAGKTTLLNALIGYRPGEGLVALNGHDFYEEYDHFRGQLGYVPQSDILHTSLTVEKALDYAARLRLPADILAPERAERIATVLETVSMNTETLRQTRISNLSGGQRKRVSIAAELLADPKLIFLDEATSGLDPGLEKKLMYTLRRMADEGRTLALITHATANIVQTDHVAFISQGRLVYFGPSQAALDFFEVSDFADIYERIERHGEQWQQTFRHEKPELHQQYILDRQANLPQASKSTLPPIRFSLIDTLRQFWVLTQRAFSVLMSDWFTLVLMLLLFPLTATLQLIIATPDILVGNAAILADPVAAARDLAQTYAPFADLNTFVFVMGLEAVLVGMYVPSNELIKERTIYLRERMVNLKVLPYLFSKVAVFTIFAAIQTALYLVVLSLGVDLPEQGLFLPAPLELFITLFLTILAGIGIGFIVSAVSRSTDMAIYLLVLLLFFQFFFAGTVFDLRDNAAEPLSYLTTTRWSLTALGVTIDMEEQVAATILCSEVDNPMTPGEDLQTICNHYPEAVDNLMLPYEDEQLLIAWGVLLGMMLLSLAAAGILIKRLDRI